MCDTHENLYLICELVSLGYLASTPKEYASCIAAALQLSEDAATRLQTRAREAANKFSDEVFMKSMKTECKKCFLSANI